MTRSQARPRLALSTAGALTPGQAGQAGFAGLAGLAGLVGLAGVALATPPGPEASREALMQHYRETCSSSAHQAAARQGATAARALGTACDALAQRIQTGAGSPPTGAAASPLARPDPTVWPDETPALPGGEDLSTKSR
ncbi:hypothetical protein [Pararhodospirillum oryzae]|uniref:Uncharacterized protein n=1 Tax=Pararhodospirillum oryzae TaxID=478448 RepID=A0A512HBY8_9PROT|nr:hypothetical protein [Pararhodospirillum oryzae]GEO82968.1 hypothetical protein ROR02_30990 [Pararhodospirillum oryzae]